MIITSHILFIPFYFSLKGSVRVKLFFTAEITNRFILICKNEKCRKINLCQSVWRKSAKCERKKRRPDNQFPFFQCCHMRQEVRTRGEREARASKTGQDKFKNKSVTAASFPFPLSRQTHTELNKLWSLLTERNFTHAKATEKHPKVHLYSCTWQ